ncbi:hypothetical protein HID58_017423 [Brassica napus]|uniref:acetyl-CoA carboxytransferase n=1 Tax=Brassica napus TaxID=3708 RepID=A0ABQ8D719_BRANA|nr:hypothetical protein HID58_017423 [Brassica napus]
MASMSHSSIALGGASASASDYLRSSANGVTGVSLRALGRRTMVTATTRSSNNLYVTARLKKGKKFDHPWPANPDPNVKGGVLSYLSEFKPLGNAQKPVTLDFERPLVELEKKIVDVRKMAEETGLDFTEQIITLETKYRQALKDLYTHLTPIQRFMELHGDRAGYDDPAIVTGIGTIDGKRYMFIGHQKGRNTKENIMRNFGMPTPHGYRKALRMMYYADHHGFPIVTFIDTPGAYADLKSEEKGQGEAIANNLRTMFGLKVPILSIVIGEGGSGGALAIGCANKMLMLENAVFYVASPEACAAILWQTSKAAPEAAEKLRITSKELVNLNVADGIIPEPLGGAHADPSWTSQQIKIAINENMNEFGKMSGEELLKHRMAKYRKIGVFIEGEPVEPEKKINMKRRDAVASTSRNLEGEVEKLREQILKAKEASPESEVELSSEVLNEMIEKLKSDIDEEYTKAAKAMGLEERLAATREEFSKANAEEHLMHPVLIERIEKLKEEFNARLSEAPNYESVKAKLDMLKDFSRAKAASEAASVKKEINKRFQEAVERPEVREKVEAVKAEVASSGASSFEELSDELKEKVLKTKREVEAEMAVVLKSMGLELEAVKPNLKEVVAESPNENIQEKLEKLNREINEKIEEVVRTPEIKSMVELLKVETAKASRMPDQGSQKIEALEMQIKQKIADALSMSGLQEKQEELEKELAAARELAGEESDESVKDDDDDEDGSGSGRSEIINPSFA